jgi:hypothetical protein
MILACLTDDDIGVILDKTGLPAHATHITDATNFAEIGVFGKMDTQ